MVIKTRQSGKKEGPNQLGGPNKQAVNRPKRLEVFVSCEEESVDVIDLGAPRLCPRELLPGQRAPRTRRSYTPNPRLYPGPAAKPKHPRPEGRAGRSRRRVFRRPVPNARLYRPAPRRVPPPAEPPRGPWPPPAPPAPALDTASRAALRLWAARRAGPRSPAPAAPAPAPAPAAAPSPPRSRRLVVTLPAGGRGAGMDAAARHSTSPDDCSDADALSAPSEFLAEFLSAIMRRQYAEALKYCRLILQYEPHNATARGFYPLLRHKAQALKKTEGAAEAAGAAGAGSRRGSSSDSSYSPPARSLSHSHSHSDRSHSRSHQRTSGSSISAVSARSGRSGRSGSAARAGSWGPGSESEGSVASQSSLELDSTSASGSPTGSGSPAPADANGNPQPSQTRSDDVENDNDVSRLQSESTSSLRRLRAQFACSIK